MRSRGLLFVIAILMPCGIFAQLSSKKIERLVQETMDTFNVTGIAVGIVKDGKIIHNAGYGVKSIVTKEKVNQHTQFAIASNSKAFTTAALAILVEEGKLSWEDRVKDHIPEFKMYNAYVTDNFNIKDLLTHRSGLGIGIGDLMIFPDGSDFTMDDILSSFQYFKPESAFRTKFDYDNLLYMIAGEVIARVSGSTWEEFVQEKIVIPLEMDNTFCSLKQMKDRSNLALPHSTESGTIKILESYEDMVNGAAAGVLSNVDDLCNWMLLHLNEGKHGDSLKDTLFTKASQREMWKVQTTLNVRRNGRYNSHFGGYGLGWFLKDINGNMSVSHTGGLPGMLSKTIMIPDLGLGIVVLTNTSNGGGAAFTTIVNTILDSYLDLKDNDWLSKINKRYQKGISLGDSVTTAVWATVDSANSNSVIVKDYLGEYKDSWFGEVQVYKENDKLWFKSKRSPKLKGQMFYYKANSYVIKWKYRDMEADAFAIFSLDEEGKAERIRMKGISPNIDFSFDFQDLDFKRTKVK